jgi:hypothetical protein
MLITKEEFPKPKFWHKDFISEFEKKNHNKRISTLVWSEKDEVIYEQIQFAQQNNSDIILSEILPDELPEKTLLREYKFFDDHFKFIPPQFEEEYLSDLTTKKENITVITNERTQGTRHNFEYLKILENSEVIKTAKDTLENEELVKHIQKSKNIILDIKNPQLIHFVAIICLKLNTTCTINSDAILITRLLSSGINPIFRSKLNSTTSLREIIRHFILNKVSDFSIFNDDVYEIISRKYEWDIFIKTINHENYSTFCKKLYKLDIHEDLWIRTWKNLKPIDSDNYNRSGSSRFQRKIIFAIIKYNQTENNNNKLSNDLMEFVLLKLFHMKRSPIWAGELNAIVSNFHDFDFEFEEICTTLLQTTPNKHLEGLLSAVGEQMIYSSNSPGIPKDDLISLRKKSHELIIYDSLNFQMKSDSEFFFFSDAIRSSEDKSSDFLKSFTNFITEPKSYFSAVCKVLEIIPSIFSFDTIKGNLSKTNLTDRQNLHLSQGILNKYNATASYNHWNSHADCFSNKDINVELEVFNSIFNLNNIYYYQFRISNNEFKVEDTKFNLNTNLTPLLMILFNRKFNREYFNYFLENFEKNNPSMNFVTELSYLTLKKLNSSNLNDVDLQIIFDEFNRNRKNIDCSYLGLVQYLFKGSEHQSYFERLNESSNYYSYNLLNTLNHSI